VSLDAGTGEMVQRINAKEMTSRNTRGIDWQLKRLKETGLQSQIQLLEALHSFGYNLDLAKEAILKQVSFLNICHVR
jgi:hypothetical protein